MNQRYSHDRYLVRRKVLVLFGGAFQVFDAEGGLVFYSKMKAFKLKEDIRLFTDEQMTEEVLLIRARSVIDFSSAYDVYDPITDEVVGALQRKGLKSMFKDEWLILDPHDNEIGRIREDSTALALLRRTVEIMSALFPQKYHVEIGDQTVATMKQNFNPFVMKLNVDFAADEQGVLDRRLGLAAAILLCAIEGKQS